MKLEKISVCVIDDEPDIRNILTKAINESIEMHVTCQADGVESGVQTILKHNPSLIFLDIKLIGGDAFTLLDILKRQNYPIPSIVINTGYSDFEYAQNVFNNYKDEVLLILQKPFWENWNDIENTILSKFYLKQNENGQIISKDKITIKSNHHTYFIRFENIQYLEIPKDKKGLGKTIIASKNKTVEVTKTLNFLENKLPDNFIRISRYVIVNGILISGYNHGDQTIFLQDLKREFGVGNSYKEKLMKYLS